MDQARLEDVLWLAVKAPKPPMTGALDAQDEAWCSPPARSTSSRNCCSTGTSRSSMARFTDPDVQKKIEELSQRSRGQVSAASAEHVTSDFAGSFKLGNGVLTIPTVAFDVPGSVVRLAGTYGLVVRSASTSRARCTWTRRSRKRSEASRACC